MINIDMRDLIAVCEEHLQVALSEEQIKKLFENSSVQKEITIAEENLMRIFCEEIIKLVSSSD
jgi:hypothetical protein